MFDEVLAERAWKLYEGGLDSTVDWLVSLGCELIHKDNGHASIKGLTGVTVGIFPSDPVTCAVQLGFATAGELWVYAYPRLLDIVNKKWAKQVKLSKGRK